MTENLHIEICPETGICSILRDGAAKVDLMPDEVEAIRDAGGDTARISAILADNDAAFAAKMSQVELAQVGREVR